VQLGTICLAEGVNPTKKLLLRVSGEALSTSRSNPISNQQPTLDDPVKDPVSQQKYAQDKLDQFPKNYSYPYLEKIGIAIVIYQGIQGINTNTQGAILVYIPR